MNNNIIPIKKNVLGDTEFIPFPNPDKGVCFKSKVIISDIETRLKLNRTTNEVEKVYWIVKARPINNHHRLYSFMMYDKYIIEIDKEYFLEGYVNYTNGNFYLVIKKISTVS